MIYQRKNRFLPIASILVILIMLPVVLSTVGCPPVIFHGTVIVYEWVDAPEGAIGEIYVDIEKPSDREVKPVADASVFVSGKTQITDSQGVVTGESYPRFAPYDSLYMKDIRVEREGYKTLEAKFQDSSDRPGYGITVFLVTEEP
jgi:hypothetical protein